ncbi:MAG: SusC/RagA family TonB-linked outer membrane protein [Agriterribacter sp.]
MKCKWLLCLSIFFLFSTTLTAQTNDLKEIEGEVKSENGEPLEGVSITVKGAENGTSTNNAGLFKIALPAGSNALIFSFTGFARQEVKIGTTKTISVVLKQDVGQLDEVVVTAVGIKNTKRSINYSIQHLKTAEITSTKEPNVVSALSGKISGVQINNSSGQPGASATIRIRGSASALGDNSPLFILDGMPIDNSNTGLAIQNANQIVNQSNRVVDLNPNDIESISVLKGPAAAALYGIRASNGAVIITSKKGSYGKERQKLKVSLYSSFSFESISRRLQPAQTKFGQGVNGKYVTPGQNGSEDSWGPLLDTLTYSTTPSKWDKNGAIVGQSDPTSNGIPVNRYDNIGNFFERGYTNDNSVSVTGNTEKFDYYFSFGRLFQKGIVPTTDFFRNTVRFGATFQATDKLDFNVSVNYFNSGAGNRMLPGGAPAGTLRSLINTPANFDITNGLKAPADNKGSYTFEDGTQRAYAGGTRGFDSPFWSLNNNPHPDNINRVVLVEETNYKILDWLTATFRLGTDVSFEKRMSLFNKGSVAFPAGVLVNYNFFNRDINTDVYLTANKKLSDDFNLKVIAGHNYFDHHLNATLNQGNNLNLPGFENISNASTFNIQQNIIKRRLVAGYASAELDYKKWLILNITGRNEWTSTLAKGQNSFFYPSASLGWIVNESLNWYAPWLDYLKLRTSFARVGNDASPYSLATYYSSTTLGGSVQGQTLNFPFNGLAGYSINSSLGNINLKPEQITSYEGGVEAWLFKNRLGIDVSVYKNESRDQILPVSIPTSTGFNSFITNAGLITNQGVEAIVTGVLVNKPSFRWTTILNFAHNQSKVHSLTEGSSIISLMSTNGGTQVIMAGQPFSVIYGRALTTNEAGKVLIDDRQTINGAPNANYGLPLADATPSVIGDPNPLWNAGLRNTLSYKNFTLSFLFDNRYKFDVYNSTLAQMVSNGVAKVTENRYDQVVFEGVGSTSGKVNDIQVVPGEAWYRSTINYGSVYIEKDLWWIRLRDVNLSYSLPKTWLEKIRLSELELTLTGRNLFLFTNYSGSDPDVNLRGGSTNGFGSDFFNYPTTKSYGIALRASF